MSMNSVKFVKGVFSAREAKELWSLSWLKTGAYLDMVEGSYGSMRRKKYQHKSGVKTKNFHLYGEGKIFNNTGGQRYSVKIWMGKGKVENFVKSKLLPLVEELISPVFSI